MRICPIREDNRSGSSGGSHLEYEVWRRWDDCLWFQDCLESEYERMSRDKRKRLAAGKGVKKNGVYIQRDQAASFDSLPPGPDPHSVSTNIHDYVPKMTKKGMLFRPNQATVDQRYHEFQACIEGLFQEDVPMLIQELRESRMITDFFGYWRRDFDLAYKQAKAKNFERQPRNSISSSVFSTYFTSSPITEATLVNPPSGKSQSPHKSSAGKAPVKFSGKSSGHNSLDDDFYPCHSSDASTVRPPCPPNNSDNAPSPYIVPYDIPVVLGQSPMESLPEEELVAPMAGPYVASGSKSVSSMRSNTAGSLGSQYTHLASFDENEEFSGNSCNRMSWQTTTTIDPASYLADLETDLTLPKCPSAVSQFPRGSMASFTSFMTDCSADAIIPLSPQSDDGRSFSTDSTRTRTLSDAESSLLNPDEDLLDIYFDGASHRLFAYKAVD